MRRLLGVLVAVLVAGVCWPVAVGAVDHEAELDGRTFHGWQVTKAGEPRPLVPGTQIELSFDDGGVFAEVGCNAFGGPVEVTEHRLLVGQMSGTAIGCRPALARQEEWFGRFLARGPRYRLVGDRLWLRVDDTVVRLHDGPDYGARLDERLFVGRSVRKGGQPKELVGGKRLEIEFADDYIQGAAGCSTKVGGRVLVTRRQLRTGRIHRWLGPDEGECRPEVERQEAWLARVLRHDLSYRLGPDRIRLEVDDLVIRLRERP